MSSAIEKFIKPVVTIQRIIGFFPVSSKLRFNTKLAATNFAFMFVLHVAGIVFQTKITLVDKATKPLSLAEFISMVGSSLVFMVSVTWNAPTIKEYILECDRVHNKFVNLNFRPKYPTRTRTIQLWFWAIIPVPLAISDILIYNYFGLNRAAYLVYNVGDALTHLGSLFFCQLIEISTDHLQLIIRYTRTMKTAVLSDKERTRLENCTKIVHGIIANCRKLNSSFSLALLFVTALAFNCMLIDGFNAVLLLTLDANVKNVGLPIARILSRIFWFSYSAYKLFILLDACSSIHLAVSTIKIALIGL